MEVQQEHISLRCICRLSMLIEPQVCLLSKEQVAQFWDRIGWRLKDDRLQRFYSEEDIVDKVCKDEMQVWTAGHDLVLLTAVITTPRGKILQIIWAHGSGIDEHWSELREKFNMYAWFAQCEKIEVLGRPGWLGKFEKEQGFRIEYVAYSADVQKPRMN